MNELNTAASERTTAVSPVRQAVRSALGAMLATAIGLVFLLALGMISWTAACGLPGILLTATVGAAAGALLPGPGSRSARVAGGLVGGLVGAYFAIASGEGLPSGTIYWAVHGGAFAAVLALPIAAVVAVMSEGVRLVRTKEKKP
jgi:hypothetical protein